jgi:hypothetical protein
MAIREILPGVKVNDVAFIVEPDPNSKLPLISPIKVRMLGGFNCQRDMLTVSYIAEGEEHYTKMFAANMFTEGQINTILIEQGLEKPDLAIDDIVTEPETREVLVEAMCRIIIDRQVGDSYTPGA